MKTAQEIFDTVKAHLLKQGKPAKLGATCQYKTAEGLRCAVGCLLPEEFNTQYCEGLSVSNILNPVSNCGSARLFIQALEANGVDLRQHDYLLGRLQRVHDRTEPKDWPAELRILCDKLNLQYETAVLV